MGRVAVAVLLVASALAGCTASATDKTGSIDGLVIDDRFRPAGLALLTLEPGNRSTVSDPGGEFHFGAIPPGHYTLGVAGWLNHTIEAQPRKDLDVLPGEAAQVEVQIVGAILGPIVIHLANGTTTLDAGWYGLDTSLGYGIRAMDLFVPSNATGLVVEAEWSAAAPFDMDMELHAPQQAGQAATQGWAQCAANQPSPGTWCDVGGSAGRPDGPLRMVLTAGDLKANAQGTCVGSAYGDCNVYAVGLRTKDASAQVTWHVVASVFMSATVPDGYRVL